MDKHIETIFTPRFVGSRFEGHRLPLEFLDDLQVLGKINTTIAKWLWKQNNVGRKRVPNGFDKGVSYAITDIKAGSTMPTVELIAPKVGLFPTQYAEYFQQAPRKLTEAIQVLDEGGDPTSVLPQEILQMMETFGASLRPDELVEFNPSASKPARFTPSNRKRLIVQVSKDRQYTKAGFLRGTLSELDKKRQSFHLQLVNGKTISGSYGKEFKEDLMDAFSEEEDNSQKLIAIHGTILYNAQDFPITIKLVSEVEFLEQLDVGWRLEQIGELKDGWCENHGEAFDPSHLADLSDRFDSDFTFSYLPHLYPMPDGSISAEWESDAFDISLVITLPSMSSVLHILNFATDESIEMEIDLNETEGWIKLNTHLEEKV